MKINASNVPKPSQKYRLYLLRLALQPPAFATLFFYRITISKKGSP